MKIASIIARYLIAFVFIVFGLNGFLHFLPMKPPSSETAMQYFTVMSASHYLWFVWIYFFFPIAAFDLAARSCFFF